MSNEPQDIYLRAHSVPTERKEDDKRKRQNVEPKWPNYALVFDCESRITADLTLTFGFWRFCELQDGMYVCTEEGIFHDDKELSAREFNFLREYARSAKPETVETGCDRLRL